MVNQKKTSVWVYIGLGALVAFMVLFLLVLRWATNLAATPGASIPPPPKRPSPNAYDYYVEAGNSIRDVKGIGFLRKPTPTPMTSTPPPALGKTGFPPAPGTITKAAPRRPVRIYSLQEKRRLVSANSAALAKLREGFNYEYMNPSDRSNILIFPYDNFKNLAKLVAFEGDIKASEDDWNGAFNSYLDVIKIGEDIPQGGRTITALVGASLEDTGRNPAWKIVDHLDAKQAKAAIQRLEQITSQHTPYYEALTEEKWTFIYTINKIMSKSSPTPSDWVSRKRISVLNRYLDQRIANAKLPYAAKPPEPELPSATEDMVTFGGKSLASLASPIGSIRFMYIYKSETQNRLLLLTLALRAYKLDNGQYPVKLTDLTSKYLSKLPDDPFAMKGTFQYKRSGGKYIIYSIGPDGRDDGGKAVFDPSQPKDEQYLVDHKSKGDIVAGVNI